MNTINEIVNILSLWKLDNENVISSKAIYVQSDELKCFRMYIKINHNYAINNVLIQWFSNQPKHKDCVMLSEKITIPYKQIDFNTDYVLNCVLEHFAKQNIYLDVIDK